MDRGHLVHLAVCPGNWVHGLAIALFCHAASPGECNVRLYLALFRQCRKPGVFGDAASRHDRRRQLHRLFGRLVDLATGTSIRDIILEVIDKPWESQSNSGSQPTFRNRGTNTEIVFRIERQASLRGSL